MYAPEMLLPPSIQSGQTAEQNPNVFLLVPGLIVVGGIAASAVFYFRSRSEGKSAEDQDAETERTADVSLESSTTTSVPGVRLSSSRVLMNENLWAFLKDLRSKVDFDLIITSGTRDAAGQARAMNTNYMNNGGPTGGGRAYLQGQYSGSYGVQAADALESGGVDALTRYIQWRIDNGLAGSGHLSGMGLDFGINHLTTAQQEQLMAAGKSLGAKIIDERRAANHIHMERIGESAMIAARAAAAAAAVAAAEAAAKAAELAKKNRNLAIGASVVGAAVLLGGVYFAVRRS